MGSDSSKSKKHPTQLTEEEIQLLLKNTRFNRQQILDWHQGFLVSLFLSVAYAFFPLSYLFYNDKKRIINNIRLLLIFFK